MSAFCDRLVTAPLPYTHTDLGAAHISRLLTAEFVLIEPNMTSVNTPEVVNGRKELAWFSRPENKIL